MQSMTGSSKNGGGASALTSHSKGFGGMCHCERSEAMTRGFTLAEVLITLAIIGVVAALTIPTLVTNYQQRGWNTAATVFERKLEESLKIMNTQGTLAGYKTTEDFVSELQKHLKITKVCKNDDLQSCFEDKVMFGLGDTEPEEVDMTTIKAAKDFGLKDWGTNLMGLQLANGASALVAYNPECTQNQYSNQAAVRSCIAILYDTSAFAKPNTSGKDLRSINVVKLGNQCGFELDGTCYVPVLYNDYISNPTQYKKCTVPDENELAKKLYHTDDLNSPNLKLDYDLANSYGFNLQNGETFKLMSHYEQTTHDIICSAFRSDSYTYRTYDYLESGSVYVFCEP